MKQLIFIILFFEVYYASSQVHQMLDYAHTSTYKFESNQSQVMTAWYSESDKSYLLVIDSISNSYSAEQLVLKDYLNAVDSNDTLRLGTNLFYMKKGFLATKLMPVRYVNNESFLRPYSTLEEEVDVTLKLNKNLLILEKNVAKIDPVVYQCISPEHHEKGHSGTDKQQLKRDHGCKTFRIKSR